MYQRTSLPSEYEQERLQEEFERVEQAFLLQDFVRLKELNVQPTKPRSGLTVLADGVNWNPGAGQGVYTYYAGAWHKLG